MSFESDLKVNFLITLKKTLSSKIMLFFFLGFPSILLFIGFKDSMGLSFRFFLFFVPYLYLFLSQDMVKDEIESGVLENVIFLKQSYKKYLLKKNLFLYLLGFFYALPLFLFYAAFSAASGNFSIFFIWQFLTGMLVSLYYIFLGGLLSFYFKGGSNVLILIIAQASVFMGLLFSAKQSPGFIDLLDKGIFPGLASKIKLFALIIIFPNLAISTKLFFCAFEIVFLILIAFFLQKIKVKKLELKRK